MTINTNKESLLGMAQKIGMSKNLGNAIIKAMGQKEFDYRSRYDIEAKRFHSNFASEVGFNNFFEFDKTLDFYDNNKVDLVDFIQKYAADNQYESAGHFIINVPFKETREVETLHDKFLCTNDANTMIAGNYLPVETEYSHDYNILYKNRMVMAATTILIDIHRKHFFEQLPQAHEISEKLKDLSCFVLKSPIDAIGDFYFLDGFMAFDGRMTLSYSIGAMAKSRDLANKYKEHNLSDMYDAFMDELSVLREQDDDYGFMGIEDENDLFITTADLPHFYDIAVNSDDIVFRQLTAANGIHLDILVNDTDYRVRQTIAKIGSDEAKEYLKNDDNEEVIKSLIAHDTECFALQFVKSDIVDYRIAAAQRLKEDLLISAGFTKDKNPLVRIATINYRYKKILDILSNDIDDEVRKAVADARAEAVRENEDDDFLY